MGRDVLQKEPMGLSALRKKNLMLECVFPIAYSRYRSSIPQTMNTRANATDFQTDYYLR